MNANAQLRTALVSGATGGIGRAICARLAESGLRLVLLGRNATALEDLSNSLAKQGASAIAVAGDLLEADYAEAVLTRAERELGPIDVVVNNAGFAARGAVQDADLDDWQRVMDVNFASALRLTRLALPGMIERGAGAVLNISSISGRHVAAGSAIYAASKHALNGFTGCLFEDVRGHGIKVSAIMPGFVDTALTADLGRDQSRMIQPRDVADAVIYVLESSPNCCPTEIVLRPQHAL